MSPVSKRTVEGDRPYKDVAEGAKIRAKRYIPLLLLVLWVNGLVNPHNDEASRFMRQTTSLLTFGISGKQIIILSNQGIIKKEQEQG